MVETSSRTGDICLEPQVYEAMMELRAFLYQQVYRSPQVMREVKKARHLVMDLFGYFMKHIDEVPGEYRAISGGDDIVAVTDYVAGMTDRYATNIYQELFIPQSWKARA